MIKDEKLQELIDSGFGLIQFCPYCGSEFTPCGNFRYCSQDCADSAQSLQVKNNPLIRLGTTSLSPRRNKDFEREQKLIKKEKRRLKLH